MEGEAEVIADLTIYYCEVEAQSLCLIERVRLTAPIVVESGGQESLILSHNIPEPVVDRG